MRPTGRSGMGNLLSMLALAVSFAAAANPASAQYPTKPIRIIVPFAAGGTTDILSRAVGAKLAAVLGQPVIADNRPGASGVIGAAVVAKASPDGYTIGMLISTHAVNPFVMKSLPYDSINDFSPITLVAIVPGILSANASLPVRSVQEMVQLVRSKPGQFNYGLPGSMTSGHLSMELLKLIAGLDMVAVSYKGGAPAAADRAAVREGRQGARAGGHWRAALAGVARPADDQGVGLPRLRDLRVVRAVRAGKGAERNRRTAQPG